MKFVSLFSGIGGFDLGFERAGMECVQQVEIDKDCQRVLAKHFPKVERVIDVTTVRELPRVDVLCGGFPCQDLSVAGKRKGLAGERSGLWYEFLRIARANQPRYVVIENVPGLLSSDGYRDFAVIIRGLVECGYCVAWRVLDAQFYGVAQRRRRVFIVGSLGDGSCAEILFERESVSWNPPTRGETGPGITRPVADSLTRSYGKQPDSSSRNAGPVNLVAATLDQRGRGPMDSVMMNLQVARPLAHSRTVDHYDESQQTYIYHENIDGKVYESPESPALRDFQKDAPMVVASAFGWNKSHSQTMRISDQSTNPLQASSTSNPAIAFTKRGDGVTGNNIAPSYDTGGGGGMGSGLSVSDGFGVRRLTPRECERLQSFPDDWTLYDADGKEISDSARYRMLGNAVCVNVAEWIGKRLMQQV